MTKRMRIKEIAWARGGTYQGGQGGCLELTNPTPVRLVHTRPSQIALLEGSARTKVSRHGAAEVGVVRDRQRLEGTGEGVRDSLLQVVVIQVKLGESGEGRDGRRDRA